MLTKEMIMEFLPENKIELFREFNLSKIGLFGSYVEGNVSPESDIDILIEFEPNTKGLNQLQEELKKLLGSQFEKEINLCREKYIFPYYRSQILNSAIYV